VNVTRGSASGRRQGALFGCVQYTVAILAPVPKGRPESGQFLLRLPPEMLAKIKELADNETRSATQQIIQLLREALVARDARRRN
jgi:hypothetical protein